MSRFKPQGDFEPQMDMPSIPEQEEQQENSGKDMVQETITTFDDSNLKHEPFDNDDGYFINNTMPEVVLDQYLHRPIDIGNVVWATTDALGVSKGTYVFPTILFSNPTFQRKIEKIAWWRPSIEITIRMNGTPMHYGKIVFAWIPQASTLNPSYKNSYFSAFSNKWIQVSANSNQATVFTIPYCHYREIMQVGAVVPDLFTLFSFVSSPLLSVNGAASPINYTIYARVVDTKAYGYNFVSNFAAQAGQPAKVRTRKPKPEAETKTDDGKVVSSTVRAVGEVVSKFDWVPVIGELAKPVSMGIDAVASVLSWFGLSVPVNLQATRPVQIRQPRMLQIEDSPTTMTVGPKANLVVSSDYAMVNDQMSSTSLLAFCQRPALVYVGSIASTAVAGTNIFLRGVTPSDADCYDYVTPFAPALFVTSPLGWMARYFQWWRGGLRVHVNFICSHFHTLRVRIYYVPYSPNAPYNATITPPTLVEAGDLISVVLDITQETDYSFTIPYMQQSEWLNTTPILMGSGFTSPAQYFRNGYWGMQIVNPLSSGAAAVTAINFQVFYSAAADFQFAGPTQQNVPTLGQFVPQGDMAGGVVFSVDDCEIPSSSMQCLMEKNYPPLGNIASGRTNSGVFHPVEITSVKQLTNMLCPLMTFTTASTVLPQAMDINPAGFFNVYNADGRGFNWLMVMSTVFRYRRGGLRISARNIDPDSYVQVSGLYYSNAQTSPFLTTTVITSDLNNLTVANAFNCCTAQAQFQKLPGNPADMVLPYYNIYKCMPNSVDTNAVGDFLPAMRVALGVCSPDVQPTGILLGGADDFILGWQLGIPQQTTTAPT